MKCPGQDMQYWKDDAIFDVKCPECSHIVEFYKDDTTRKCHHCGHRFVNPKMDFGCATYCQFAEQCLGTLPEDFVLQQDNLLKDKVAVAMKRYFKSDFKNISLASKVARYAEQFGKSVGGANLALILCSSYLLNIGYPELKNKKGEEEITEKDLQLQGPAVAAPLLQELGADIQLINGVCNIIGGKPADGEGGDLAFSLVMDARRIVQLEELHKNGGLDEETARQQMELLHTSEAKEEIEKILVH